MTSHQPGGRRQITFILIAVVIMIFIDQVILGGWRPYIEKQQPVPERSAQADQADKAEERSSKREAPPFTVIVQEEAPGSMGFTEVEDLRLALQEMEITAPAAEEFVRLRPLRPKKEIAEKPQQVWKDHAVKATVKAGAPKVVIILDDVGVNRSMSLEALKLDPPVTLAFLPYAAGVDDMAQEAGKAGHELLVHMPMEPLNGKLNPGPGALLTGLDKAEFEARLARNLSAIEGYVGINNHMGSRLTQDPQAMAMVMEALRKRGLLFVDSRTIHTSIAAETAEAYEVPYVIRDVFLDHYPDYDSVMKALGKMERMALRNGVAVGIGHPKKDTIRALKDWIPLLEEKGIALVPVSAVVKTPAAAIAAAQSAKPLQRTE